MLDPRLISFAPAPPAANRAQNTTIGVSAFMIDLLSGRSRSTTGGKRRRPKPDPCGGLVMHDRGRMQQWIKNDSVARGKERGSYRVDSS
jgi:hypothetical protein